MIRWIRIPLTGDSCAGAPHLSVDPTVCMSVRRHFVELADLQIHPLGCLAKERLDRTYSPSITIRYRLDHHPFG